MQRLFRLLQKPEEETAAHVPQKALSFLSRLITTWAPHIPGPGPICFLSWEWPAILQGEKDMVSESLISGVAVLSKFYCHMN